MSKIDKIKLKNFKSHQDTVIELSDGITAILGDPQDGKSNILKSLKFVTKHRPTKFDRIINNTTKDNVLNVTLDVEHNKKNVPISLTKTKNGSEVLTEYQIGNNEPLSTVGVNVPETVSSMLNLSDIYMQEQTSEPFLIMSSHGEVSKIINKIVNLDQINRWIKNIKSNLSNLNSELKIVKKDHGALLTKIKSYDTVDEMEAEILRAEALQNEQDELIYRRKTLQETYSAHQATYAKIIREKLTVTKLDDSLKQIKRLQKNFSEDKDKYYLINGFVSNRKKLQIEKNDNNRVKNGLKSIKSLQEQLLENKKTRDLINSFILNKKVLEKTVKRYLLIRDKLEKINSLIKETKVFKNTIIIIGQYVKTAEKLKVESQNQKEILKEYRQLLTEAKVCPTCKTTITKRKIDTIIKGL